MKVKMLFILLLILPVVFSVTNLDFRLDVEEKGFYPNEEVPLDVTIVNRDSTFGAKDAELTITVGQRSYHFNIGDLNPGGTFNKQIKLPSFPAGTHTIKGEINYIGIFDERFLETSYGSFEVLFPPIERYPRNVYVSSYDFPENAILGESYKVSVTVTNDGDVDADILIEFGSINEFESKETRVAAGESITTTLNVKFNQAGISFIETRVYALIEGEKYLLNYGGKENYVTEKQKPQIPVDIIENKNNPAQISENIKSLNNLGEQHFCSADVACGEGQGDCDSDSECKSGLSCRLDVGEKYGFSKVIDICKRDDLLDISIDNIPIVFIHGHALNPGDAPTSIKRFEEFQKRFEIERLYLDKGAITLGTLENEMVKTQDWKTRVSIRVSYYLQKKYGGESDPTFEVSDQESITIYARRLGETIESILNCANVNKVNIIAHSMGGLVAREYIKQTNGKNVNKLIMLGTPNSGVGDFETAFCAERNPNTINECTDMFKDGKFITSLNGAFGGVNYYTVAGDGDFVVPESSVRLNFAHNKVANGCGHSGLIEPSQCADSYNFILDILKNKGDTQ